MNQYKVRYGCGNCNKDFDEQFKVGTKAPEKTTCPICGNYSAVKKWK